MCNPQSIHVPPRLDRGGQNTRFDIPLAGVYRNALSRGQWRLVVDDVLSNRGKHEIPPRSKYTAAPPTNPQQPCDHGHLETACDEHVPRVSPCPPASIDPGFVKIGLVQLSQSIKKTNVAHTRQAGRQTNTYELNRDATLYAPHYEAFFPFQTKKRRHCCSCSSNQLIATMQSVATKGAEALRRSGKP